MYFIYMYTSIYVTYRYNHIFSSKHSLLTSYESDFSQGFSCDKYVTRVGGRIVYVCKAFHPKLIKVLKYFIIIP